MWTPPVVTKVAAEAETLALGPSFHNATIVARNLQIDPALGAITHVHMRSDEPIYVRPQLWLRPNHNENYLVRIYDHPATLLISGFRAMQLLAPVVPKLGVIHPGAYITSAGWSAVTPISYGRAEYYPGDAPRIAQFQIGGVQDTRRLPLFGVTQTPTPWLYHQDFDWPSDRDGWDRDVGGSPPAIQNDGSLRSNAPYTDDTNHDLIVSRMLFKQGFPAYTPAGVLNLADFSGATIEMKVRWAGYFGGGMLRPWYQTRPLENPAKYANYYDANVNLNAYADGQWHEISFPVPVFGGALYAGASVPGGQFDAPYPFDPTRIWNHHLPWLRFPGAPPMPSTNTVELDWWGIRR